MGNKERDRDHKAIVQAFRRRRREATIADIVAETGIPTTRIEAIINDIVWEYRGHLKVTESGEILYYFPYGMQSRITGARARLKRFFARLRSGLARAGKLAFKVWTMVMLIGYFVLFVVLLLAAAVGGFALAAKSGGGGDRRGGLLPIFLMSRLMNTMFFLWMYSDLERAHYQRSRRYGRTGYGGVDPLGGMGGMGGGMGRGMRLPRRDPNRPERRLYHSIFAFVFGDPEPEGPWDERERNAILEYLRGHDGVITLEELMALTGRNADAAQELMNELVVGYEGEPEVGEQGTIVYCFDRLLARVEAERADARAAAATAQKSVPAKRIADELPQLRRPVVPFNNNPKRVNKWIAFFNGFNLLFGGYFTAFSFVVIPTVEAPLAAFYIFVASLMLHLGAAAPILTAGVALGLVPFSFSVLFFLIPWVRRRREGRDNQEIKRRNLRTRVYRAALANPDDIRPDRIVPQNDDEKPDNWREEVRRIVEELAGSHSGEVEEAERREQPAAAEGLEPDADVGPARYRYRIPALGRAAVDVAAARERRRGARSGIGEVVYDTGEGDLDRDTEPADDKRQ